MASKKSGDYFGIGWGISVVLCFFFGPILGIIQRILDGKIVAAILRILFGWNLLWIIDFIDLIVNKHIFRLLDC
jgi:hypothetical protein